jgi:hypothetical protein
VTELLNDESLVRFPWSYDVIDLGQGIHIEKLQRSAALVVLTDKCDEATRAKVRAAVKAAAIAAKSPMNVPNSGREELLHCVLEEEGKLAEAIRELGNLPSDVSVTGPQYVLLDLPKEEFASIPASLLSTASSSEDYGAIVRQFSGLYRNYSLRMDSLKVSETEAN